ncbi:hypothetical protein H1R20_g9493, partial [Candolleomyces eurysporus]
MEPFLSNSSGATGSASLASFASESRQFTGPTSAQPPPLRPSFSDNLERRPPVFNESTASVFAEVASGHRSVALVESVLLMRTAMARDHVLRCCLQFFGCCLWANAADPHLTGFFENFCKLGKKPIDLIINFLTYLWEYAER